MSALIRAGETSALRRTRTITPCSSIASPSKSKAAAAATAASSFRREKYVPHGGPDGGDGGDGGSVIVVAENGVNNLAALAQHRFWRADSGYARQRQQQAGPRRRGSDHRSSAGTLVIDAKAGFVLKDLASDGESVVAARGGDGGKGNTHFKSATNRAPREATPGGEGERRELLLELKVIADVGLIGKPNAGKSDQAGNPFLVGWRWLLVSLRQPEPVVRSYLITDGAVVEEQIALLGG